jgi:UDPglucose 6-dehydrogenase
MEIGVIGTGHVGLVTAAALAHLGHDVTGIDEDASKIEELLAGRAPFFEPELEDLVVSERSTGRLSFSHLAADAVKGKDVVFVCVGTPTEADGEANLLAVERASELVATTADGPLVVVEKSTVPAGTAQRVAATLAKRRPDVAFDVASNPEFLREGSAVRDALEPDRLLVGADSAHAFEVLRTVYARLIAKGVRLIETDVTTAELAKHASNAFLALKISYANALARICERAGGDVVAVADVMGADPRIGPAFLGAGLGYGGYCFPKDVAAFGALSRRLGYAFPLLDEIARINDDAVDAVVALVKDACWNVQGKRVAVLGLSFKPGTDDLRLSPALALVDRLARSGADVVAHDPEAARATATERPDLRVASSPYEAASGAHAVVIATAWPEYLGIDWRRMREVMADTAVIDARNALDARAVVDAGLEYRSVGRPGRAPRPG